jgi:serine/threonine protein kinase
MSDETDPTPSTPTRPDALNPSGLIYSAINSNYPEAIKDPSDDVLLKVFNMYATKTGYEDAKITTSELDIIRRCYVTDHVNVKLGLFKGHIVETKTNDDGVSEHVNVPVFIKRVTLKQDDKEKIEACIKREKVYYGVLSEKSTHNEICKLKVAFVLMYPSASVVCVFVISEYCEGRTIKDFVINVFPFLTVDPSDVVKTIARKYATKFLIRLAKELLEIILWIHSNGYIYMDIKPDNFIVGVVEYPTTDEMWSSLFSMPRILRAIDFGALQQFNLEVDIHTDISLKNPVTRSFIAEHQLFLGQPVGPFPLPPYKIRSTDYNNTIKQDNIIPSDYESKLTFKKDNMNVFFSSRFIEKRSMKIVQALYSDVHGAWLMILSLIWYCAPYYNTLLIKFILLLRGMIVNDTAGSVKLEWIDDTFCTDRVVPYLQTLYTLTEKGDEVLLAIDNTAEEARIEGLQRNINRITQEISDGETEKVNISTRFQEITKTNQARETEVNKNKIEIDNIKKYNVHTQPLYREIADAFEGTLLGGSKTRRITKKRRTTRRKTTRRKTTRIRIRELKNKKKNNI